MLNPVSRRRGFVAASAVCALVIGLQPGAGASPAQQARDPLTPRTHFTMKPDGSSGLAKSGEGIPNFDSVKATVRTYYNASSDGIADKKKSPYITEVDKDLQGLNSFLAQNAGTTKPAIVLDTDDTTLWTYDMEDGAMHFNFDPTLQNQWVQDQKFPAVPGMAAFVDKAAKMGYTIFGLTGRNDDQKTATLANLTKAGYGADFTADKFFTKWTGVGHQPAAVLHHLRDGEVHHRRVQGGHPQAHRGRPRLQHRAQPRRPVVGPPGRVRRQGGEAAQPDVLPAQRRPAGAVRARPGAAQRVHHGGRRFQRSTVGGENIPNIDSAKATIRAYYGATDGIAAKHASRYITEMKKLRDKWAGRLATRCANQVANGNKPAVVFDADDTTLWTYDMEDAAMHFNFDPALQDEWVQDARFPAVPGMKRVVKAAKAHGCKVFGDDRSRQGPESRNAEEPAQVLRRRVRLEAVLHEVGRRSPAGVRHLRRGRRVHPRGVQVADPRAHRGEVRREDHRQLRRPVLRPARWSRTGGQAAQPDVLPAVRRHPRHQ